MKKIERSFLSGFFAVIFLVVLIGCEGVPKREFVDHVPADLLLESVPYTLDEKGRMFIDGFVNGSGPYTFIIDTASSRTLIFENVRRELGLEFTDGRTTFVHGATLSERRPVLPLEEVRVGTLAIRNIKSFTLPDLPFLDRRVGGVLGMDFLSQYAVYVSVEEQTVHFARTGYKPSRRVFASSPVRYDRLGVLSQGLPFVEASINGKSIDALLDLGAGESIANWASASVLDINVNRALRGRFEFTGAFGDIPVDAFMHPVDVGIGERIWNGQEVGVSNLRIFETMERLEEPTMIISAGLLRDEDLILDFPAGQIFLRANREQRLPTRRQCRSVRVDGLDIQCF